jgi:ribonuclease E
MLIDATHPEQTRVAVVDGHRLIEYDFETQSRKQLKGNIYLAKVIRIEPSLQAAFVEYGGNRHGFLAFSEIHHDYYRIPVADRQALEESLAQERAMGNDQPFEAEEHNSFDESVPFDDEEIQEDHITHSALPPAIGLAPSDGGLMMDPFANDGSVQDEGAEEAEEIHESEALGSEAEAQEEGGQDENVHAEGAAEAPAVDMVGGDEVESHREHRRRRFVRRYKIQEVIKRGQIMLVQVVKEERGNKGAALTTYLSLAGRYCVLMPNTDKGGGISRKITSMQDRRRMKDLLDQLEIPGGMAVILRTAGMERSKVEVKRDLEYLLRLWDSIRELTLKSIAPSMIYEEANLIKRAMRDLYTPDIDNILVEGDDGYHRARDFMRMLMPSHARRVHHYRDQIIPLFFRYQVENQINGLHSPTVQLRSGGYIVINQTEALVAIDVNSGRSTRERNIEETAYRTNMEAAEEIARQLRLRDLAGLIVIDFIDMEDGRNNSSVERRLKESMRHDRARLQIGRISHFGLLELSRQRLRPSLLDLNFEKCTQCQGTGHVRHVDSSALLALHAIEEEGMRQNAAEIIINMSTDVANYILNHKRVTLDSIEKRYGMSVRIRTRDDVIPPDFPIERTRTKRPDEQITINTGIDEQAMFDETDRQMDSADEAGVEEIPYESESGVEAVNGNAAGEEGELSTPRPPREGGFGDEGRDGGRGARGGRRRGRRGGRRRGGSGGGGFRDNSQEAYTQYGANDIMPVTGDAAFVEADAQPRNGNREGGREGGRDGNREGNRDGRRDGRRDGNRGGRNRNGRGGNPRHQGERSQSRPPRVQEVAVQNVPISVYELDTTPRDGSQASAEMRTPPPSNFAQGGNAQEGRSSRRDDMSAPQASIVNEGLDVSPEKKKTGWWQRLTGA